MADANDRKYSLRPQARPVGDSTLESGFRVYMTPQDMQTESLAQGDRITLRSESTGLGGVAIVWRATDNIGSKRDGTPIIRISEWLRGSYSFELKDKFFIKKWTGGFRHISTITVTNLTPENESSHRTTVNQKELEYWAGHALAQLEAIGASGSTFEVTPRQEGQKKKRRRFLVEKIEPLNRDSDSIKPPYYFDHTSKVLLRGFPCHPSQNATPPTLEFKFDGLIGLDGAFTTLTEQVSRIGRTIDPSQEYPLLDGHHSILIHGAAGTGKSTVLERLSEAAWGKVLTINDSIISVAASKTEANLAKLFDEAVAYQPSLIIIDDLDAIAVKTESGTARALSQKIRGARDYQIQIIATATRSIDIHEKVARCFLVSVELPIPNAVTRFEMLQRYVHPTPPETLRKVAQKTHGFVAEDLCKLCIVARKASNHSSALFPEREPISGEGFEVALRKVHASITGEAFVDIPKVFWSDIGGSEAVKTKLGEVINFFFGENQDSLSRFDVKPTSGILLYGPPGCSKTLTAKALATESGFNFLAVKGPELISKFVGDTEYNIREVFRKARAAAPCVIFFDEIDSMAVARGDRGGHEALNSVTALLNELDGIEELKGVLVLAATNRPGKIDKALLRPGRLGKHMYLGPPDLQARKQILNINTRNRHLAADVSIADLANRTERYSGADVAELCRIAAMEAFNEHLSTKGVSDKLTQVHFETAFKEVRPGISEEMIRELEDWTVTGD